jgi:hypothetical protein
MTEREQQIADAYESYCRVRKLPAGELCIEVVNMALQASGMDPMNGDERRRVDAFIRCTWDAWPGSAVAVKPDREEWPGWPAGASTAGPPGRCTLWD